MKKNILIVSIYYPPIQSIASNRIYSFAKYLDKNKFNIFIHTLDVKGIKNKPFSGISVSRSRNNSLFKKCIFDQKVNKFYHYLKVVYNRIFSLFVMDDYQGWTKESIKFLSRLVEEKKIDCIVSSFGPDSSHVVALALKKQYPNIIWVADMRDEMSASPFIVSKQRKRYQYLETEIFQNCNAITSVSKPILDEFKSISGHSKIIFKEVRNGYDFNIENADHRNNIFTISYVGNFYGTINPNNFFIALSQLVDSKIIPIIKIKLIGVKVHLKIPDNLADMVEIEKVVSHSKAIRKMQSSDALLLVHPSNGRKGVFTGKLFEYLACLKPIIALVDKNDVAAQLILDCNAGHIAENENIDEIKESIVATYDEWLSKFSRDFNVKLIEKHHRKMQTKKLDDLIVELING